MRGEANEMSSACIQSGIPPMARFQHHQNNPLAGQSPEPASWQFNGSIINMKQEPLDEARNDSGVTSGSDCPSASPGSDRSDNHPYGSQDSNRPGQAMGNGHFINTQIPYHTWYRNNFVASPTNTSKDPDQNHDETLTPTSYRNSVSPKIESGDENSVEYDEQGIRVPKVNSHGKIKVHKCKQCDFVAYTKLDFWEHSKVHIKGDKILKCPRCPFVTEYKHHLEYHLLNHAGAKPFKCDHCDYSCVNKSMLNSHLKSHSKIYQYRCSDCLYETKYCHSLKLHLRKYKHKPAMVLNPDGTPNPLPIIDVYGTRRGPKVKRTSESSGSYPATSVSPGLDQQHPMPFNPLMNPLLGQNPMLPFPLPLMPGFPGVMPNPEMFQNFQKIIRERLEEMTKQNQMKPEQETQQEEGVLDLSSAHKPGGHSSDDGDSDDDERMTTAFDNVEVVETKTAEAERLPLAEVKQTKEQATEANNNTNNNKYDFACQYCGICFGEEVLYRIHMGYHGYSNPFTCNMCGEECENKVNFFLHIARAAH